MLTARMRLVSAVIIVGIASLLFAVSAVAKVNETRPFEIKPGSFHFTPSTVQAGAHKNLTTTFDFAHNGAGETVNDVRNTIVELPPGFMGNPTAVPTCTEAQLFTIITSDSKTSLACPPASQVGTIRLSLTDANNSGLPAKYTEPIYNMEVTSYGIAAQLGFNVSGVLTQMLTVSLRPGDSGLTVTAPDIINEYEVHEISVTIWGVPASPEHNAERGFTCSTYGGSNCGGGGEEANIPPKPFLSMPTSCTGEPLQATLKADSWEHPEEYSEAKSEIPPVVECERIPFDPSIVVAPTTDTAESSSGLNVSLLVPQTWENPETIATSNLKNTVLTLPVGYTINPSAGSGLGVCAPEQFAAETSAGLPGSGCPEESKIGSVEVETPVLAERLTGSVFVAKPFDNPFDSLLGLYVVVKSAPRGILVKLAGHIEPNPVTGQLVTTFDENPQVPFSRFTLKLRQGATSPLVSPPACGSYTAEAGFTPWSAPAAPQLLDSVFQIEHGIGGGACPTGGVPPFHPGLVAGTLNNSAGSYSPMDIHITRNDGEQEITGFSSQLPPGLTANLSGIPFCSEADIAAARSKTGAEEEAEPVLPGSEPDRAHAGRGWRRLGARLHPGQGLYGGPIRRRPLLDRRDHLRKGRPVRPRHRCRAPAAAHQPRNRGGEHPRGRGQSDPAHHRRDRDPRPRHPRLHRTPGLHAQPDQLRPPQVRRDGDRRRRGPHQLRRQRPGDDQRLLPARELPEPQIRTQVHVSTSGRPAARTGRA